MCLTVVYLLTCSLLIIYIIRLRQIIASRNKNSIQDTEDDPRLLNNNNDDNNGGVCIDRDAVENDIAIDVNPINGKVHACYIYLA